MHRFKTDSKMKISLAQIRPVKGNISTNIATHKKLIALAIAANADAIFFPELSITGYEPELAKELATNQDDKRFDDFQQISDTNKIIIGIGVPTKSEAGTLISMIIFQPNKSKQTYSKQQLHADELPYFVNGNSQTILAIENIKIAIGICYESLQTDHAENANKLGATIYIASVAKSQNGINKALVHYPIIATKFSMTVLMTNCVGYCDNFESVGKSAVWNDKGELIGEFNDTDEGILIFDTGTKSITQHEID